MQFFFIQAHRNVSSSNEKGIFISFYTFALTKFSSKGIHKTKEDPTLGRAKIECQSETGNWDTVVFLFKLWRFWSIRTISVACMPDFTDSRFGNKFQGNEWITFPGKEGQIIFHNVKAF